MKPILEFARQNLSGILTADRYFRSIEGCFNGGFCPTKLFDSADPEQWAKALDLASESLVYSDDEMLVKDVATAGMALTPGAIMDFDAVITTTRKDRDGDILETSGAELDPHAPLLWQHIPLQPIGKVVSKTVHTKSRMEGRFAIADTELGRDAAVLVEMKALRISHGFEPDEYEPLEGKEGRFRILKLKILEISLVSIPSNVDAVITAFSRNKLHTPLVKGWAKKYFDARPVQGKGFDVAAAFNAGKATQEDIDAVREELAKEKACTCQKNKDVAAEPAPEPAPVPSYADHATACLSGVEKNLPAAKRLRDALGLLIERTENERDYGSVAVA